MEFQWIQPELQEVEVASLGIEPAGSTKQEYGFKPELAYQVVADLQASDVAPDALSAGASAHLQVCEKYWST